VLGYDGTAQRAFHSTNRSTWTSATPTLTGTQRPRAYVNKVSGRIVAVNTNGTSTINVMTSDDGGQNWTARTALTSAFTSVSSNHLDMAYGATDGAWLMTVTNTTNSSEVWRSTNDGTSWSLRATLAGGTVVQGSGLAVIAGVYRDAAVAGSGVHPDVHVRAVERVHTALEALERNPNETLLLQHLLLDLPSL
jgi:hypothetical protein